MLATQCQSQGQQPYPQATVCGLDPLLVSAAGRTKHPRPGCFFCVKHLMASVSGSVSCSHGRGACPQATVRGLEPLLAQAVTKVERIQERVRAILAQRAALRSARPQLAEGKEEEEVLRSMVDKFALPRLRARITTAYMFYDKAAHAAK